MAVGAHQSFSNQPGTSIGNVVNAQTAKQFIRSIELVNTTGTAATITLHLVRSGNTAGALSQIVPTMTVNPNSPIIIENVATMMVGDTIQGLQGTAGSISVHTTLVEVL